MAGDVKGNSGYEKQNYFKKITHCTIYFIESFRFTFRSETLKL